MNTREYLILLTLILTCTGCGHGNGGFSTSSLSIPPRSNEPPTATDATIRLTDHGVYEGRLPGVDPDGDPITFELIRCSGPVNLLDPSLGTFIYAPSGRARSGHLVHRIVYRVSDDRGLDDLATVTLHDARATTYLR